MAANSEFTRLISIEGITPDKERTETVTATADECAALAARFDIRELSDFTTEMTIRRVNGNTAIRITGKFSADVVQACVVSLQDVHAHVTGEFETYFTEENVGEDQQTDIVFDHEENVPEAIQSGMIDLGEVAAQYLSLDIDPYPRAPGVSLAAQMAETAGEQKAGPFAVLETLKEKTKK